MGICGECFSKGMKDLKLAWIAVLIVVVLSVVGFIVWKIP